MARIFLALIVTLKIVGLAHDVTGAKYKTKLGSNYTLVWEVEDEFINFAALVKTSGWVGLGLNTKPKMDGADIVITGVKDDRPYLFAYHGVGHHLIPDENSFWGMGYGKFFENETSPLTLVNMIRPLDPGHDAVTIEDKPLYLLWSYGLDDNLNTTHVERGAVRVNLINPKSNDEIPVTRIL